VLRAQWLRWAAPGEIATAHGPTLVHATE